MKTTLLTPVGYLIFEEEEGFIIKIEFLNEDNENYKNNIKINDSSPVLDWAKKEMKEYFELKRKSFTFPFKNKGTEFREKVWQALSEIPYGETISYKQLAVNIGNPKAVRAVGGANNKNNLTIVVPCHRVIGSDDSLVGYGGGLWRKEWLLAHEKKKLEPATKL